jgi:hypothetical protein
MQQQHEARPRPTRAAELALEQPGRHGGAGVVPFRGADPHGEQQAVGAVGVQGRVVVGHPATVDGDDPMAAEGHRDGVVAAGTVNCQFGGCAVVSQCPQDILMPGDNAFAPLRIAVGEGSDRGVGVGLGRRHEVASHVFIKVGPSQRA